MAAKDLVFAGKNQALFVSADIATPVYKLVMCQTSVNIQSSKGENITQTKCGPVDDGEETGTCSVEGMAVKKPGVADATLVDVIDFWENYYKPGTTWLWKVAPQDITAASDGQPVQSFKGKISSNSLAHPSESTTTFSFEINIDGDITTTAFEAE